MIELYHLAGTSKRPPCGKIALLLTSEPGHVCFGAHMRRDDGPPADAVVKLDGSKPQRGEEMRCGSCGKVIYPYEVDKLTVSA